MQRFVFELGEQGLQGRLGNKAGSLLTLASHGFVTPKTYVCAWDAYEAFLAQDASALEQLRSELESVVRPGQTYAVRSSANLEDGSESSFAGQFASVLSVEGSDNVFQGVMRVWESTCQDGVTTYLGAKGLDPKQLRMAVIVQHMVPAVCSGVAFTKNPTTGLDEIVVEAVSGSGEALVQQGITPSRWIHKWGAWTEQPEQTDVSEQVIHEVVQGARSIAKSCGRDVDLEWVHDGHQVHWVQLRDITTINDVDIYSNHISKETLPGLIKPLVWSVNIPLVSEVWGRILDQVLGPNVIDPSCLVGKFYHRAYFNMGVFGQVFAAFGLPKESMELMMGIDLGGPDRPSMKPSSMNMKLMPRLLSALVQKLFMSKSIERLLGMAKQEYAALHGDDWSGLDELDLLTQVDRIFEITQRVAYYNIHAPLLQRVYGALLAARLKRQGVDADLLDLTAALPELAQFDPNQRLLALHERFVALDETTQHKIIATDLQTLSKLPEARAFSDAVRAFLRDFGHLSDSTNDFSVAPWRERPDLILKMAVSFAGSEAQSERLPWEALPLTRVRRLLLTPLYQRARRYRYYRDAVGSLYIYGYGLFRPPLLALGNRLASRGLIAERDDVFYLELEELREAVSGGGSADLQRLVADRKADLESVRNVVPPTMIFGAEAPPANIPEGDVLKGTPTSRGVYTGPARLVRGMDDWRKLQEGDVLVIPYSDVGWTPLFAKASAVVAESGGLLSHSSIVAREYGIPAVVSVPGALTLKDGTIVTVDGFRGEVSVHHAQADEEPQELAAS